MFIYTYMYSEFFGCTAVCYACNGLIHIACTSQPCTLEAIGHRWEVPSVPWPDCYAVGLAVEAGLAGVSMGTDTNRLT